MMGVGKSTIGKLFSKKFNIQFEDIDEIIERKLSLSIKEIFETKGEKFFREIEEKVSKNTEYGGPRLSHYAQSELQLSKWGALL